MEHYTTRLLNAIVLARMLQTRAGVNTKYTIFTRKKESFS